LLISLDKNIKKALNFFLYHEIYENFKAASTRLIDGPADRSSAQCYHHLMRLDTVTETVTARLQGRRHHFSVQRPKRSSAAMSSWPSDRESSGTTHRQPRRRAVPDPPGSPAVSLRWSTDYRRRSELDWHALLTSSLYPTACWRHAPRLKWSNWLCGRSVRSFVQRHQLGDEQQLTDRPRTTADITRRCFSDCIIIIIIHFDGQPRGTSVTAMSRLHFATNPCTSF